jgi:glutaredoxin 3
VSNVVIYTTRICAYCRLAKDLLEKKGIAFSEVDVSDDDSKRDWLFEASGQRTVPQIFINDQSVGGFQELCVLDRKGELDNLLSERHLESGSGT